MLNRLRRFLRKRREAARREQARRDIEALQSSKEPKGRAIGAAVGEALHGTLSPEEREIVTRVEQRRAELEASRDEITVIDYGAGDPGDTRTDEEMAAGVSVSLPLRTVCSASKDPFWALVLFKLVRGLESRTGVELGTCVGLSASYQSFAQNLSGGGRFVSLEGSPGSARIAEETLAGFGLNQTSVVVGPFQETYRTTMAELAPVDYLFIDGHHDRDATIDYFEQALPHLAEEAVIVFDDISWNEGMKEAWRKIKESDRLSFSLDLGQIGVVVVSGREGAAENYEVIL